MVSPRVFVGVADAAVHAEPADDLEDHVLRVDAARRAGRCTRDAPHLQRVQREALRREHVAHLRRADAERDGAERAVRRGVAVAARDRHPRLRQPQLRADDVDDALRAARQVEQPDAMLAAVALERRRACPRPSRRGTAAADRASGRCDRPSRSSARETRTVQPRARSMSNACGVVTSWMRCRPMNSWVCPFGSRRTVCASQTFWSRVEGIGSSNGHIGIPGFGIRGSGSGVGITDLGLGVRVPALHTGLSENCRRLGQLQGAPGAVSENRKRSARCRSAGALREA